MMIISNNNTPYLDLGQSIFTTIRYQDNQPYLWERHWQRLAHHALYFGYDMPKEDLILNEISKHIIDHNVYKVRIIINSYHYYITIEPYILPQLAIYHGVDVMYASVNVHPQLKYYKTTSYLPYHLALKEAQKHNKFESLMLDDDDNVVDGARTSILLINNNTIIAPLGGLMGTMREEALSYAQNQGIMIKRCYLKPKDMVGQILLANSLMGIIPVGESKSLLAKDLVKRFCPKIIAS